MNLEQIDTSTTAGKAEVMRLAAEGRRVAARSVFPGSGWKNCPTPVWDWHSGEYAIISEPFGPEEVYAVVFPTHIGVWVEQDDAKKIASEKCGAVVRYLRADLAGEVK